MFLFTFLRNNPNPVHTSVFLANVFLYFCSVSSIHNAARVTFDTWRTPGEQEHPFVASLFLFVCQWTQYWVETTPRDPPAKDNFLQKHVDAKNKGIQQQRTRNNAKEGTYFLSTSRQAGLSHTPIGVSIHIIIRANKKKRCVLLYRACTEQYVWH